MTNKEINDKKLPKNFNLFVLIKKEIQEKKNNQNIIGQSRERKREFLEREALESISGKND